MVGESRRDCNTFCFSSYNSVGCNFETKYRYWSTPSSNVSNLFIFNFTDYLFRIVVFFFNCMFFFFIFFCSRCWDFFLFHASATVGHSLWFYACALILSVIFSPPDPDFLNVFSSLVFLTVSTIFFGHWLIFLYSFCSSVHVLDQGWGLVVDITQMLLRNIFFVQPLTNTNCMNHSSIRNVPHSRHESALCLNII